MMRALIVDDEAPARNRLARLLAARPDLEVVGEAGDGLRALEQIEKLRPDLVFLDIEMPELDGLGVAEALGLDGPALVFITAYNEHALRAFEVSAIDYLVKPIAEPRLAAALEKVRRARGGPGKSDLARLLREMEATGAGRRLAVRCGAKYLVFDPSRVSAVVARDHYAAILCDGRELLADDPLDVVAAKLRTDRFIRVHRSALINLDFLQELEREGDRKYTAVLSDRAKTRVPISRDRLDELKDRLGLG